MENPAHNFTTGIPMSTKGNGDHSNPSSDGGEVLKHCREDGTNGFTTKGDTVSLLNDFAGENGVCYNASIQDGDQCELFYNIVCGTSLQGGESISVPSPQTSACGGDSVKYSDSNAVFHDAIGSVSSVDVVVQCLEEPIDGLSLTVPELTKCTEGQDVGNSASEQKSANESISAIAQSFGLEDLIPETFHEENGKDLFGTVKEKSVDTAMGNFSKQSVELHIPESPIQLSTGPDLLDSYSQESVAPFKKSADFESTHMRVPVIMEDGSTRYVICSKEELVQDIPNSEKSTDERVVQAVDKNDEICRIISESEVECVLETVAADVSVTERNSAAEGINRDCPMVTETDISVADSSMSDLLTETLKQTCTSSSAEPATISIATDSVNHKMKIILTTSQGKQCFEVDTANLGIEPVLSKPVQSKESLKVCQNTLQCVSSAFNSVDGELRPEECHAVVLDEEEELQCEEDVAEFMKKITSQRGKPKEFACPAEGCGAVFSKESKLRVHMISHKGTRPYKCNVDGCNWAFTTLYRLRRHCETHFGTKNYACDFEGCNRRFTTVYNLKTHQKRHICPFSLTCPAEGCEMSFGNRRKLELHLRVHEDIEAPYKCGICGKTYYSANCIASHYRTHQYSEDDFKCPFVGCTKKYDKICRLKQHLRHHTGERPYSCPAAGCKWSFMSASKLTRHMRKHTGERKFVCSECGKSFMRPEHLKGHVVIHSGDKPFQCPHENCNARFTAKSSLYVHVKKHCASGLKIVYPCPVARCLKKYNNKATLKQHIQKVHPNMLKDGKQIEMTEHMELMMPVTLSVPEDIAQTTVTQKQNGVVAVASQVKTKDLVTVSSSSSQGAHSFVPASKADHTSFCISSAFSLVKGKEGDSSTVKLTESGSLDQSDSPKPYSSGDADLISGKLLQENSSGSARTDFCCTRQSDSAKKLWSSVNSRIRRGLQVEDPKVQEPSSSLSSTVSQNLHSVRSSPDVLLASSSMVFQETSCEQLVQAPFLHDEPSSSGIYQDDAMLVNSSAFSSELPMSASLLSDNSDSNSSAIVHSTPDNSFSASNAVDEFTDSAINLHCLD